MASSDPLQTKRSEIVELYESGQSCSSEELGRLLLADASEVRLEGVNTMPLFRRFAKKFTRTHEGYIGHNDNGAIETAFSGPGYFRLTDSAEGRALFDYRVVPSSAPSHWPTIRSNSLIPYRFVYGSMVDSVRIVADDLIAGKAYRVRHSRPVDWSNATELGVHFLLVRKKQD